MSKSSCYGYAGHVLKANIGRKNENRYLETCYVRLKTWFLPLETRKQTLIMISLFVTTFGK